jgi:hypothetical protein
MMDAVLFFTTISSTKIFKSLFAKGEPEASSF